LITEQDWDHMYEKSMSGRKVVVDDFWRMFRSAKRKDELKEIDDRARQMARSHLSDTPKAKWRHLGKQSLMDVPSSVPLEKILMEQAGVHHEYGAPWVCDKCGARAFMGLPPDKCPSCGYPSLIVRRLVNLRA